MKSKTDRLEETEESLKIPGFERTFGENVGSKDISYPCGHWCDNRLKKAEISLQKSAVLGI